MRVVSLVPSATETLLGLGARPAACTRFCEQPGIVTVGGTKDPNIGAIIALAPDLVVVNDEENRFEDAARLVDAGFAVHSMSPRSVAEVGPEVRALADAVGVRVPSPFGASEWVGWLDGAAWRGTRRPGATLVWRRPWMTQAADTYGSSLLSLLGIDNVFADDPTRYFEVTLEELAARLPEVVVLPSEPYPFAERHVVEVRVAVPDARVWLLDGRHLFWWGIRTPSAVEKMRAHLIRLATAAQ